MISSKLKRQRAVDSESGTLIDSECSICLEFMHSPVLLPCRHKFCFPCLNTHNRSMELEGTCPLCRSELPGNLYQYLYNNAAMFLIRANHEPFGSDKRLLHISMAQSELKKLPLEDLKDDANIRFCFGDIHLCLGEFAEALEIYESLKTRIPERKVLLILFINISHAQIGLGLFEAAKTSLGEAMRHCDQTDAVHTRQIFYNFSRCAYETGMLTEAIDFGEQVIEMNRHYEGAYTYVALAHKAKGNLAEAARTMQRACAYETPWDSANVERVKAIAAEYAQERDESMTTNTDTNTNTAAGVGPVTVTAANIH